jgi:hypothetical protein
VGPGGCPSDADVLGHEGIPICVLQRGGLPDVVVPILVLVGFGVLFTLLAAARFRFEESEAYYG